MNKITAELLQKTGFRKEVLMVKLRRCPFCGEEVKDSDFRDALSKKEFAVSGLCQKCQDETFGKK